MSANRTKILTADCPECYCFNTAWQCTSVFLSEPRVSLTMSAICPHEDRNKEFRGSGLNFLSLLAINFHLQSDEMFSYLQSSSDQGIGASLDSEDSLSFIFHYLDIVGDSCWEKNF